MARSTKNPRVTVSGRSPHFFKVFFPNFSSEHLKIPPNFCKHIVGEKSQKPCKTVSLKDPSGSTWYVDLVNNSRGFFFENGWKKFVTDHSLSLGDFLVFRYDGKLGFTVILFDATACEKDEAFTATPCQDNSTVLDMSVEGEIVGEEASEGFVVAKNGRVRVALKRKRGGDDFPELNGHVRKKRCNAAIKKSVGRPAGRKSKSSPHCRQALNNLNSRSLATHSPSSSSKAYKSCKRKASLKLSVNKTLDENPIVKSRGRQASMSLSSIKKSNKSSRGSALILSRKMPTKNLPIIESSKMLQHGEVVKERRPWDVVSQQSVDCPELNGHVRKKRINAAIKKSVDRLARKSKSSLHCRQALNSLNSRSLATHSPSSSSKAYKSCKRKESLKLSVNKPLDEIPKVKSRGRQASMARSSIEKSNKSSRGSALILSRKMPSKNLALIESSQMLQHGEVDKERRPWGVVPQRRLLSQRRPITEEDLDKAREMSQSFQSIHPFFTIEMKESYVCVSFFLYIPISFTRKHFPDGKIKMTLWDPNKKSWEVTYISYEPRGGYFSGGWSKFARANNLEKGDVCVFELVKKYHLKVHFFRVVEEITPLIWCW